MTPEIQHFRGLLSSFWTDYAAASSPAESAAVFQRIGDAKRAKVAAEQAQATVATADTAAEHRLLTARLA